jgi:hypothetical protein
MKLYINHQAVEELEDYPNTVEDYLEIDSDELVKFSKQINFVFKSVCLRRGWACEDRFENILKK